MDLLDYDAETGVFRWKKTMGGKAWRGTVAGSPDWAGYIKIKLYQRLYCAHRLAWLVTHKAWPENDLDHINCDKSDNRIVNLRAATRSQNICNVPVRQDNKVGLRGVSRRPYGYIARITSGGKRRSLGMFKCPLEAHAAYCRAAKALHGEFARTA